MSDNPKRNYTVVESPELSTTYDKRYVVVDPETNKVLDDAQGYGYKSVQKAHAAYTYKTRTPEQKKKHAKIKALMKEWCKEHKKFIRDVESALFYDWKDGEPDLYKCYKNYLEQYLSDNNIKLEGFNAFQLYKFL